MKKLLLILLACIGFLSAGAIQPVGEWEIHASFRTPKQICEGSEKIFFLADNSLFSYGKVDREMRELSRLNILSDNRIARIASQDENDMLVVIYDNSNIDLIDMADERAYNLPYIKNASLTAKGINDISFYGDETYLATDFGIVVLNNDKKEIKTTYTFNEKIRTAARRGDYLYCIRADYSLYRCRVDGIPYDINSWEKLRNSYITQIRPFADGLFLLHQNGNLYHLGNSDETTTLFMPDNRTLKIETHDERLLLFTNDNEAYLYDNNLQLTSHIRLDDSGHAPADVTGNNRQNRLWIIDNESVVALEYDASAVLAQELEIPCNAYQKVYDPFSLTIDHGRVYVATAGVGYLNDEQDIEGYISILENGTWTNIFPSEVPTSKHPDYTWGNLYNVTIDPDDKNTFYVGSWFEGLYRFKNNSYDTRWNDENSTIGNASNWAYKAGYTAFDKDKKLYVITFNEESGLSVMRRDETWYRLDYDELKNQRNLSQILIPEKSSAKWVVCPAYNSFVFAFNDNGTEETSDDQTRKFTTFTDQNGEGIDGSIFYDMAEDRRQQQLHLQPHKDSPQRRHQPRRLPAQRRNDTDHRHRRRRPQMVRHPQLGRLSRFQRRAGNHLSFHGRQLTAPLRQHLRHCRAPRDGRGVLCHRRRPCLLPGRSHRTAKRLFRRLCVPQPGSTRLRRLHHHHRLAGKLPRENHRHGREPHLSKLLDRRTTRVERAHPQR